MSPPGQLAFAPPSGAEAPYAITALHPADHSRHALHDETRDWPETNCYVDLWIELLAARGFAPEAALGFTLMQDWEGDQFTFFKFPLHDLEGFYGAVVQELSIYDSVEAHAIEQAARGRAVLVEVDGFYLPDTRGVSYQRQHTKTTIAINRIDPVARQLEYFHNAGFFALDGEDYDGVFAKTQQQQRDDILFPYVEFVRFDGLAPNTEALRNAALARLREHYARRPKRNPVRAFAQAIGMQAEAVAKRTPDFFHVYAFNTLRQLGANFELCGTHLAWLFPAGDADKAIAACKAISGGAKSLQFQLARAAARKRFSGLEEALAPVAEAYDALFENIARIA
ncbi:MAG: hypothetical protein QOG66_581 [Methylobacteriaceae bacterium]|jgi:hypothetical protein|nr:hypothetical protein [Methylobacteriaceae bacterium]